MNPDYSDDEGSISSYEAVRPIQYTNPSFALIQDVVSRIPGKESLGDDEMPDVLYTAQYCTANGKVLGSQ